MKRFAEFSREATDAVVFVNTWGRWGRVGAVVASGRVCVTEPRERHDPVVAEEVPVSNALPVSMTCIPAAPRSHWTVKPVNGGAVRDVAPLLPPVPASILDSASLRQRMSLARDRIRVAAESGHRVRAYEVALDFDLSEFHFARQFRVHFGCSPHRYYNEVRAERARRLLLDGLTESEVARCVGLRRPAELRALLNKRADASQ